jgi:hypothetical protein
MSDYKVGDYLINKRTKQIVKIVELTPYLVIGSGGLVYKFDNNDMMSTNEISKNYNKLDLNCPVAQVLYANNSNKAVTNETNEE